MASVHSLTRSDRLIGVSALICRDQCLVAAPLGRWVTSALLHIVGDQLADHRCDVVGEVV
jgi:hypothetical protein